MPRFVSNHRFREPKAGHVWRRGDGQIVGTVDMDDGGGSYLTFDSPDEARAFAAACEECAVRMEALETEDSTDG
jgi:hypothetical protein